MCCCSYSQWVFLLHFFPSTKEQWYQGGVCTAQRTLKGNSHLSQSVHHAAIWQAIQKYKTLSFLLSSFSLLLQAVSLLNDPQHFTTKNSYFFFLFLSDKKFCYTTIYLITIIIRIILDSLIQFQFQFNIRTKTCANIV